LIGFERQGTWGFYPVARKISIYLIGAPAKINVELIDTARDAAAGEALHLIQAAPVFYRFPSISSGVCSLLYCFRAIRSTWGFI
jgi:hypothetical protein